MLIIFSGLPGVGKSKIACELALQLGATYLRIDSIEQAIRDSGLASNRIDDSGYRVAHAIAEDNLRLGRTVIADCVNPLALTRDAWLDVAKRAKVRSVEIEVVCSDANEHRHRVETRISDIPGLILPSWEDVVTREYQPWNRQHIIVDTSFPTVQQSLNMIRDLLPESNPDG
jgi:predicted kinase